MAHTETTGESLDHWQAPVETLSETIDPWRARALAATLDIDTLQLAAGDVLPPAWHWIYFLPAPAHGDLGEDGHAVLGGFLPPVSLPSRMWVAGTLRPVKPLRLGETGVRTSSVTDIVNKAGRSGPLCFVTISHRIVDGSGGELIEEQKLVYRERQEGGFQRSGIEPPGQSEIRKAWRTDERMLFRYSALLFNAHRIHYDIDYCRSVEGYPGLVVHGPLLATALWQASAALAAGREVMEFRYQAHAPVFHVEPFWVCSAEHEGGAMLWVEGEAGDARMTAEVVWG